MFQMNDLLDHFIVSMLTFLSVMLAGIVVIYRKMFLGRCMLKHLGITCHDSDSYTHTHTHTSWMCMEREYRDGKMLTIGESKWKGIGEFIVLFFSVCLGLSNIQCWERGTWWGISQERAWCFRHSEGADLIELHSLLCLPSPCSWAPVRLSDIILLLGPSWYQPCHHRSVPQGAAKPLAFSEWPRR